MSQYCNLLFIAYFDKVYVFKPQFPSQKLPSKPELILDLPISRPGLTGYNDPSSPHAVNHLIVGDIGSEEVLIASCDDGDVVAYTIRSIDLAVEEAKKRITPNQAVPVFSGKSHFGRGRNHFVREGENPDLLYSPIIEPWFLHNVGQSAWGLATHKTQRLLAVSSNTTKICVFAFSLGGPRDPREAEISEKLAHIKAGFSELDPIWVPDYWQSTATNALRQRSRDFKIVLAHHKENIPNISFYSSDRLDEGTYLASTDIKGNTYVWDVWNGKAILEKGGSLLYSTIPSLKISKVELTTPGTVGWGVACLDPKASRCTEGQIETFGCKGQTDDNHTIVDISEGSQLVADNSQWHPGFSNFGAVPGPTLSVEAAVLHPAPASDVDMDDVFEVDEIDDDFDEDALEESDDPDHDNVTSTSQVLAQDEDEQGNHSGEHFTTMDESDGEDPDVPAYTGQATECTSSSGRPISNFQFQANQLTVANPFTFSYFTHVSKS